MRGLVLASILLTASSLAASTINANFFAVAFSEVDAASNNSQFFLNLNQVSASSGSNFSGGLSPLYPVTGELSEVSSSSASLIGGMLHSRAATSLQANPIIYDGGGAISQAFIGDTLTVTGPVLHQNLRLTFQINGSSFFYGGNSQYLQSLATLDVYVYAPLTWNTELTGFILHQSVPLSSGTVAIDLPFDTIGTSFGLIVGLDNTHHFSGNAFLPPQFPRVSLTSLNSFDVNYNASVIASLPPGVSLTSASASFPVTAVPSTPTGTITTADHVVLTYNKSAQTVNLTATVNALIPVNGGNVTFRIAGIGTVVSGPVVNGSAIAQLIIPADQAVDSYSLSAEYSGNSPLNGSVGSADLSINPDLSTPSNQDLNGLGNPAETGPPPCFLGEPVNCTTGSLVETITDLAVRGRGRALRLSRTYNALDAASAAQPEPIGFGWTHSYAAFLRILPNGNAIVHQGNGAIVPFFAAGSGFTAPPYVIATLAKNLDGTYTFTLPGQTADIFSASGRLLKETGRNGYQTLLTYNGGGQLVSVTDPAGRSLIFSYSGNGLVSSVTDPIGRQVHYAYDLARNLTAVIDAAGNMTRYTYDGHHRIVSTTDPNGGHTSNAYDSSNRVVSQTDPAGRTLTWWYVGGTSTVKDGNGHVTKEVYQNNRLASITRGFGTPDAATDTFTYDAAGNRNSWTDGNGHTTHTTYDSNGNPLTVVDPLGRTTTSSYDAQNNVLGRTDPLGVTTTFSYDVHGNLAGISRPLTGTAQTWTTTLQNGDPSHPGDVTAEIDTNGKIWSRVYDAFGNLVRRVDPIGGAWTGSYNGIGWLTSSIARRGHAPGANPADFAATRQYSPLGDLLQTRDQLGHPTAFAYDANRNRVIETDANGHTTRYTFDADNEAIRVNRADGAILLTAFDAAGNRTGQTDGLGRTTTYGYDALDRLVRISDPLGRMTRYTYDQAGNRLTATNPAGQTTTYTYDAANELTGISYSDGTTPSVTFAYDADGRRISMTDGTGASAYQYDSLHRLVLSGDGAGNQVHYGYDLRGGLTGITYPSGKQVTRGFDAAGRLISVADWLGNQSIFHDDPDGDLTGIDYANGVRGVFGYDRTDRAVSMDYFRGGSRFLGFDYSRDSLGLVSGVDTDGQAGDAHYSYNALHQLTAVNRDGLAYDHADNLLKTENSQFSYDAANELLYQGDDGGASFLFDVRGNRVRRNGHGGTDTYRYDQADRLVAVGFNATYSYNGVGLRMRKVVNGAARSFAWDMAQWLPRLLAEGSTQFVYGPHGMPLEQIAADGSVLWFHQDPLGSTRALTDRSGSTVARYGYSAYGQRPGDDSGDDGRGALTPLLFAGEYTDAESGFQYLLARYYDPATGQFLTRDPLAAVTREPYLYAGGNPINSTDPTGLKAGLVSNFLDWLNPFQDRSLKATSLAEDILTNYANGVASGSGNPRFESFIRQLQQIQNDDQPQFKKDAEYKQLLEDNQDLLPLCAPQ